MLSIVEEQPGKTVTIKEGEEHVLTYSYGDTDYLPHFHPIYSPNGKVVTERSINKYPPGLCFSFGKLKDKNNQSINLYRKDIVLEAESPNSTANTEAVKFICKTTWNQSNLKLIETCKVTLYPSDHDLRILDLSFDLYSTTDTIRFEEDIKLSYFAPETEHRKSMSAFGGIGESEVDGREAEWVTICCILEDVAIGLSILPNPDNGSTFFNVEDTYQGFLSANTRPSTLKVNQKQVFNYRVLIYLGDLFTFDVEDQYNKYIDT